MIPSTYILINCKLDNNMVMVNRVHVRNEHSADKNREDGPNEKTHPSYGNVCVMNDSPKHY